MRRRKDHQLLRHHVRVLAESVLEGRRSQHLAATIDHFTHAPRQPQAPVAIQVADVTRSEARRTRRLAVVAAKQVGAATAL
jgi:hypothetical protein